MRLVSTLAALLLFMLAGCTLRHPVDEDGMALAFGSYTDYDGPVLLTTGGYDMEVRAGNPVRVTKDHCTLDFWSGQPRIGAIIGASGRQPDEQDATGLLLERRKDVRFVRGRFEKLKVGIYAKNCQNLIFEHISFSDMYRQRLHSTPVREDGRDWLWPHNNDNEEWVTNYGACIVLENCKNCVIRNCSAKETQNGIILDRCSECEVYDNDFSYCSGWGCALWRSNRNSVAHNRFDYCLRGFSNDRYARGQDSAGILVFEQCCDNVFAFNSATHCGDGLFLYAGHETTQRTGNGGCNRNLIYGNDFSFAAANGVEATFSGSNVVARNKLKGCDFGLWGGYSYNTLISDNDVSDSLTAGVAIEHGQDNWIEGNRFTNNKTGVWLWWDEDKELTEGVFAQYHDTSSKRTTIVKNRFTGDLTSIQIERTEESKVSYNEISAGIYSFVAKRWPVGVEFSFNNVLDGEFWGMEEDETGQHSTADPGSTNYFRDGPKDDIGEKAPLKLEFNDLERPVAAPKAAGAGVSPLEKSESIWIREAGRQTMIVGPWGPVDYTIPAGFAFDAVSCGEGRHWLVWPRDRQVRFDPSLYDYETRAVSKWLVELRIVPKNNAPVENYGVAVSDGGSKEGSLGCFYTARGTILQTLWTVSFWQWTPKEHSEVPPDWDKLISTTPLATTARTALEYSMHEGAPETNVPADHFATVSTTMVALPAGTWKFTLISDDGARLFVDGEKVIERWDVHGATDDVYTLKIENPRKVALRVEHFENKGWASLALRIERK